jgi:K+-transporting ATPase ATPase A chain
MMMGRFGLAIPALALAGSDGAPERAPITVGILRTDSLIFGVLLIGSLLMMTAVSYLPALALVPILEQLTALACNRYLL